MTYEKLQNVNWFVEAEQNDSKLKGEEDEKDIVISYSHAVVDPGTVVVESLNALVADSAMAGASSSDYFAFGTEVGWVDISEQF